MKRILPVLLAMLMMTALCVETVKAQCVICSSNRSAVVFNNSARVVNARNTPVRNLLFGFDNNRATPFRDALRGQRLRIQNGHRNNIVFLNQNPHAIRANRAFIVANNGHHGFNNLQFFGINPNYVDPGFRAVRAFAAPGFHPANYYQPQFAAISAPIAIVNHGRRNNIVRIRGRSSHRCF